MQRSTRVWNRRRIALAIFGNGQSVWPKQRIKTTPVGWGDDILLYPSNQGIVEEQGDLSDEVQVMFSTELGNISCVVKESLLSPYRVNF
ncbi:hypothetical protein H7X87_03060 [Acetobacteraceae bacterium]|nr:hypothetical protein [Candidatus Parcubacteria bacterium]